MEGLGSQEWERGVGDREESGEGKAAEYQQRKGLCQAGIAKAVALCRRISRWRMAVFLLVGLFFYGGHQWHPALYLAAAAGCILFLLQKSGSGIWKTAWVLRKIIWFVWGRGGKDLRLTEDSI